MSTSKTTLVIGASTKPERYSYKAIKLLRRYNHDVIAFGRRKGQVQDVDIETEFPSADSNIHTITMYISCQHQAQLYDKMLALKPKRVIFNPGTENSELKEILRENKIVVTEYCTLIMLHQLVY